MLDELNRVQQNLKTVRDYLAREFPGFNLTEDTSDRSLCHKFTLTDLKTYWQYKLKVAWPRLSDQSNTPDRTTRSLVHGDVAEKMRKAKGEYFFW